MKKYGALLLLLAGCSTVGNAVISDESLKTKAAFALETNANKVKISDRTSDGLDTIRFNAKVKGKKYQCYITTVAGVVSSEAICARGSLPKKTTSCNALLRAAKRCK